MTPASLRARFAGVPPLTLLALPAVLAVAALLAVLPPLPGALAVAAALVGARVLLPPALGLYLLLRSSPVQDYGAAGELTVTNALFGLTLVAWLARRAATGGRPFPRSAVGPCFVLFVATLALSLTAARELGPGVGALFQWGKSLAVYFMALDLLRTRRQVALALGALVLAGAAEAGVGLLQFVTGAGPASFAIGDPITGGGFSRAYGTFGRPNSYAGYLEMIFPLALALAVWLWQTPPPGPIPRLERRGDVWGAVPLSPWGRGLVLAAGAGAALIGVAILASFSRGAWLGTLGGLVVMTVLAGRRSRGMLALGAVPLLLFLLVGGSALIPATVQARLASITAYASPLDVRTAYVTAENFAILERQSHWLAGLNMVAAHPLLGVGLGNFDERYPEFGESPTFLQSQGHAHNYYIHVAAEAGLAGLLTYLLLLGAIVLSGLRALRAVAGRDRFAHAVVVAALGVVTALAIHQVFEVLHVLSMGIQLSVVWALFSLARDGALARSGEEGAGKASESR